MQDFIAEWSEEERERVQFLIVNGNHPVSVAQASVFNQLAPLIPLVQDDAAGALWAELDRGQGSPKDDIMILDARGNQLYYFDSNESYLGNPGNRVFTAVNTVRASFYENPCGEPGFSCTEEWNPVCSNEGKVESNPCYAGDAYECMADVSATPGADCTCDDLVICTTDWDPVCGADGKIYSNPCRGGDDYACKADASSVPGEACSCNVDPILECNAVAGSIKGDKQGRVTKTRGECACFDKCLADSAVGFSYKAKANKKKGKCQCFSKVKKLRNKRNFLSQEF